MNESQGIFLDNGRDTLSVFPASLTRWRSAAALVRHARQDGVHLVLQLAEVSDVDDVTRIRILIGAVDLREPVPVVPVQPDTWKSFGR